MEKGMNEPSFSSIHIIIKQGTPASINPDTPKIHPNNYTSPSFPLTGKKSFHLLVSAPHLLRLRRSIIKRRSGHDGALTILDFDYTESIPFTQT